MLSSFSLYHAITVALATCLVATVNTADARSGACTQSTRLDEHSQRESMLHERALELARSGQHDSSQLLLRELQKHFPCNRQFLYDRVTVLAWSGQYPEATAQIGDLDMTELPSYTLLALAQAARSSGFPDRAFEHLKTLSNRAPLDTSAALLLANLLIDTNRPREALTLAQSRLADYPEHKEVLEVIQRAAEASRDWSPALDAAQRILSSQPLDSGARQLRFVALWAMGAAHLAGTMAPHDLDADTRARLRRDQLAFSIRWARLKAQQSSEPGRWQDLDNTIEQLRSFAKELEIRGKGEHATGVRHDLIVALSERVAARLAEKEFETVARSGEVPAYVRIAAGISRMHARNPELAAPMLLRALEEGAGESLNTRISTFYALLESQRHDEAIDLIDRTTEPEWLHADNPDLRRPNPAYPRLLVSQALARSFTLQLADAQRRLEDLKRRAPANSDVSVSLANLYRSRGWPRRAERELRWVLGRHPDYSWAKLALHETYRALDEWRLADEALEAVRRVMPEEPAVQRITQDWRVAQMRTAGVRSIMSWSDDANPDSIGGHERTLEGWAYSTPVDHRWRVAANVRRHSGHIRNEFLARNTAGLGIEYRNQTLTARALLYAVSRQGAALSASLEYRPDDYWRISAAAEIRSPDAPLRAWHEGTTLDRATLSARNVWNEARATSVTYSVARFSDGNQRNELSIDWNERVLGGPRLTIELQAELAANRNSIAASATPYFNPRAENSAQLGITLDWTQWRRYEHSIVHRFEAVTGRHVQHRYGAGNIRRASYTFSWTPNAQTALNASVAVFKRPYDGVSSTRKDVALQLNLRF